MKTYLFYDIETSGLNYAFDQILTFACIRTDLDLNELDRNTITIQLRRDIVPSPKAFLTHGLTDEELRGGISEYEAALKIHKIVNTPGTISAGYNSLGFDDEFIRFLFYRNLLDPYEHQYSNGCSRMDILPMAVIYRVFHPESMNWPQIEGKPSLKLDLIARENQFVTSGRAHEAMNDVEALIELSRRLFQQKAIWEYCIDFFNKTRDEVRINHIKEEFRVQNKRFKVCLMVSASFGPNANYLSPVVCLGPSSAYKNQMLWLRLDAADILGLETDEDLADTFVVRKRFGDQMIILPPLERFWEKLPRSHQKLAENNLAVIRQNGERFFDMIHYHREYKYPVIQNLDLDAALYQDGFFSAQEKKQSHQFHRALSKYSKEDKKNSLLDQIQSPRIKKIAGRILVRNFNDTTIDSIKYLTHVKALKSTKSEHRVIGYRNDTKFNYSDGLRELKEIEKILHHPDQDQADMMQWLKQRLNAL